MAREFNEEETRRLVAWLCGAQDEISPELVSKLLGETITDDIRQPFAGLNHKVLEDVNDD